MTFFTIFVLLSCQPKYRTVYSEDWSDPDLLPEETGGEHLAIQPSDYPPAGNGLYIYLPSGYKTSPVKYPTLVFFHGAGEVGNSIWDLEKVLKNGPPRMIEAGEWDPPVPFIVISPQSIPSSSWNGFDETLTALAEDYPIDKTRTYFAGLSMGATTMWNIIRSRDDKNTIQCAAGVAVRGTIPWYEKKMKTYIKNLNTRPIWAFNGQNDPLIDPEPVKEAIAGINETDPLFPVKLTLFPELNHTCWEEVFTSKTETLTDPDYDPFDTDIYSWMLNYRRIEN